MDYKAIAQQANQEVLSYNQDMSGWKLVKASKKITVFSKASRRFLGSLMTFEVAFDHMLVCMTRRPVLWLELFPFYLSQRYRVEGVIPEPPNKLSAFLYQPGNRVKWDKSLQVHKMVHRIDSETFICHTITQSFALGSISPRDFIDLIHIKHYEGNMDIISSYSVDFPEYPPSPNYIRGYNHPCGYVCSPLKENPAYSRLVMFVQTEMRGKLPSSIIERTMPSNLVSFVLNAKDGIKSYRPSSAHEHYGCRSSFQRKKGRSSIKS